MFILSCFCMSLEDQIQVFRLVWCLNLLLCGCDETDEKLMQGMKRLISSYSPSRQERKGGAEKP